MGRGAGLGDGNTKRSTLFSSCTKPLVHGEALLVILTVDASPFAVGWAVGQDDSEGQRYATRFGAKTFDERQRRYPQIKRELWGLRCALHQEQHYLIGAPLIVETDCLPLIGMIVNCTTPDIAMLRWVAFVRSFNPDIRHIKGKDNSVADMLSFASFKDQDHESDDSDRETEMNYNSEERNTGYDAIIGNAEQVQVDTGAGKHIGNKTVSRTDGQE
jgi:hypothetical protein